MISQVHPSPVFPVQGHEESVCVFARAPRQTPVPSTGPSRICHTTVRREFCSTLSRHVPPRLEATVFQTQQQSSWQPCRPADLPQAGLRPPSGHSDSQTGSSGDGSAATVSKGHRQVALFPIGSNASRTVSGPGDEHVAPGRVGPSRGIAQPRPALSELCRFNGTGSSSDRPGPVEPASMSEHTPAHGHSYFPAGLNLRRDSTTAGNPRSLSKSVHSTSHAEFTEYFGDPGSCGRTAPYCPAYLKTTRSNGCDHSSVERAEFRLSSASATSLSSPLSQQVSGRSRTASPLEGSGLFFSSCPASAGARRFQKNETASRYVRGRWRSPGASICHPIPSCGGAEDEAVHLNLERRTPFDGGQLAVDRRPRHSGTNRFATAIQRHIERMSRGRAPATRNSSEQGLPQAQTNAADSKSSAGRTLGGGGAGKLATGAVLRSRFFSRNGSRGTPRGPEEASIGDFEEVLNSLVPTWSAAEDEKVQKPKRSAARAGNSPHFPADDRSSGLRERQIFTANDRTFMAGELSVRPRSRRSGSQVVKSCQSNVTSGSSEAPNMSSGRRQSPPRDGGSPVTITGLREATPPPKCRERQSEGTSRSPSVSGNPRDRSASRCPNRAGENLLHTKTQLHDKIPAQTRKVVARTASVSRVYEKDRSADPPVLHRPRSVCRVSRSPINGRRAANMSPTEAVFARQARSMSNFSARDRRNEVRCESRSRGVQAGLESAVLRRPFGALSNPGGLLTGTQLSLERDNVKPRSLFLHGTKGYSRNSIGGRPRKAQMREVEEPDKAPREASPPASGYRSGQSVDRENAKSSCCRRALSGSSKGIDKGEKRKDPPKLPHFRSGSHSCSSTGARHSKGEPRVERPVMKASRERSCSRQRLAEELAEGTPHASKQEEVAGALQLLPEVLPSSRRKRTGGSDSKDVDYSTVSCCSFDAEDENEKGQSGTAQKATASSRCSISASTEWDPDGSSECMSEDEGTSSSELTKEGSLESDSGLDNCPHSTQTSVDERSHAVVPHAERAETFLNNLANLRSILRETDPTARRAKVDKMHAQLIGQRDKSELHAGLSVEMNSDVRRDKANPRALHGLGDTAADDAKSTQERPGATGSGFASEARLSSRIKLAQLKADLRLHVDSLLAKVQLDRPLRDALRAGLSEGAAVLEPTVLARRDSHVSPCLRGKEEELLEDVPVSTSEPIAHMHSSSNGHGLDLSFMHSRPGYHSELEPLPAGRFALDTILEDEEGSLSGNQDVKDTAEDHALVIATCVSS